MGDSSKFVPMADAPTKMLPFKKQTSRSKGVYHAPPETLPSMIDKSKNPGAATKVGMWFNANPPDSWGVGDAHLRAEYPVDERGGGGSGGGGGGARRAKHAAKDAEIARLQAELISMQMRSPSSSSVGAGGGRGGGRPQQSAGQALFASGLDGAGGGGGGGGAGGASSAVQRAVLRSRGGSSSGGGGSGSGGFAFTTDAAHTIPRGGYLEPARGRPRTATVSHEVLWSEMPNSLYRSHAVEVASGGARGALRTGMRGMRRESRAERRGAVAVSIPYC